MNVIGVIVVQYKQVFVPPFRGDRVPSGEICCYELLESVWGDSTLYCIGSDGMDPEIVLGVLFLGGPPCLFDPSGVFVCVVFTPCRTLCMCPRAVSILGCR